MKNRGRFIGAGLLALVLALGGCSNPLDEQPVSPEAGSGGKLVIQIGDMNARTLAPDIAGIEKYRIVLSQAGVVIEDDAEGVALDDLNLERSVQPGTWSVKVIGLKEKPDAEDNASLIVVAEGNASSIIVDDGATVTVPVTLMPYTEDYKTPGTFRYDIVLPADNPTDFGININAAVFTLTPDNAINNEQDVYGVTPGVVTIKLNEVVKPSGAGEVQAAGSLDLPAGRYTMSLIVPSMRTVNSQALTVRRLETVYIYPALTTPVQYVFTIADDFTAVVHLKGYFWSTDVYAPPNYQVKRVELRDNSLATGSQSVSDVAAKFVDVSLPASPGNVYWDMGDIQSEWIGGKYGDERGPAYIRYVAYLGGNVNSTPYYNSWESVALTDGFYGEYNYQEMKGVPIPPPGSVSPTRGGPAAPFAVNVSWPANLLSYANGFAIRRNGTLLNGNLGLVTGYTDTLPSPGGTGRREYSYTLMVKRNGMDGEYSQELPVSTVSIDWLPLPVGSTPGRVVSGQEVHYYSFRTTGSGSYNLGFTGGVALSILRDGTNWISGPGTTTSPIIVGGSFPVDTEFCVAVTSPGGSARSYQLTLY